MKVVQFIESLFATMPDNTRRSYSARLREFCAVGRTVWPSNAAGRFVERASVRSASRFVAQIAARNLAPQNQRVYIVLLWTLYKRLMAARLVEQNIFEPFVSINFREETRRKSAMVPFEKVQKLIDLPPANTRDGLRDRAILAVLFGCGLRRAEVRALRVNDIMLSSHGIPYLRLKSTKGGRPAQQPLPAWVMEYLAPHVSQRGADGAQVLDYLFVRQNRKGVFQLGDKFIYRLFKNYSAALGLCSSTSPHSARATAITRLLAEGVPHSRVREFSRHQSVAMVERYDRLAGRIEDNPGLRLNYKL